MDSVVPSARRSWAGVSGRPAKQIKVIRSPPDSPCPEYLREWRRALVGYFLPFLPTDRPLANPSQSHSPRAFAARPCLRKWTRVSAPRPLIGIPENFGCLPHQVECKARLQDAELRAKSLDERIVRRLLLELGVEEQGVLAGPPCVLALWLTLGQQEDASNSQWGNVPCQKFPTP